ncbi:sulfurtransferase [Hahella sp. CCB-MM4]|uniref:sulfurtransferase n=1 Tax=Hahella sp. (strain CCB-MM4) TaxID=1926491 RepID=UPI000B9C2EFF|nr:sulfurtransferase [Hahella sp. CCB-MM4]OZG73874.1 sulfurtransferase [Hahella sp. CCB-MM4]
MLTTAQHCLENLEAPSLLIVDCRFALDQPDKGRQDYLRGHIPGAIYADLNKDLSAPVIPGVTGRHPLPDVDSWRATLEKWGITPATHVIAYDDAGCAYAARLWWMLKWIGHENVSVLDGGWSAWIGAGYPVSDDIPEPEGSQYPFTANEKMVISAKELLEQINAPDLVVIDARGEQRYRGEVEPIDPVAGHIPGAYCHPFTNNLNAGGQFKPAETLREGLQSSLPDDFDAQQRIVCYCGSGVTACNNILAATLAGLPMPVLYAGSWSDWITDSNRPVAVDNE